MKKVLILSLLLSSTSLLIAQVFTKMTEGLIVETISDSRSVNIVDLNGDGWDDVFISNGLNGGQNDLLYLNNGDDSFTFSDSDITNDGKSSVGATFADYDNDGDIDAFVTNWYGQTNELFANDGTGIFEKKDAQTIPQATTFSETAAWGDYDNDGWLDLYVTNSDGNKKNNLFQNQGQGTFVQIDTGLLVLETDLSRNTDWLDIDLDGDLDLLVSNENNQANDLYLNDGADYFSKVNGLAVVTSAKSTMSFSYGDIDNDGDLDLFFANAGYFQEQNNQLFKNVDGLFELDEASILSTDGGCSYSSSFGDYDNDGDLDLIVSNGFCNASLENFLYENDGSGNFQKVTGALPDLTAVCSYGLAWGDLNNDGFLDLVTANCKNNSTSAQPVNDLYWNNGNTNNWISINLEGSTSNRSAIGAQIWLTAIIDGQEITQLRTITAHSGYSGQNSLRAHFGLKNATTVNEVKVRWPSGIESMLSDIAVNQILIIEEQSTGVNSIRLGESQINIAPNPNDGKFNLSISLKKEGVDSFELKVVDVLGRMMHQQICKSEQIELVQMDLSHLPIGKYVVLIYGEGDLLGEKRFVKH